MNDRDHSSLLQMRRSIAGSPAFQAERRPVANPARASGAPIDAGLDERRGLLRCPACRERVGADTAARGLGVVACACGRAIPFAAQVLVDVDGCRASLMEAVQRGDPERALRVVLQRHAARAAIMGRLGVALTFRRYVRHSLVASFVSPVASALARVCRGYGALGAVPLARRMANRLLGASVFNLYMRNRFATPSFIATVPLLGLALDAPGLVLDAPCGYGHLSFALSRLVPERQIVAMDLRSAFAYSARRFFVPGAAATIAHDMNHPLPLADGQFSAIFCSDAFHYIRDKRLLAREFMRLLRDDGVAAITHVHNRLHYNLGAGDALAPGEYERLFDGFHVRMFTEEQMIDAYRSDTPLDLTVSASCSTLERSPAIVLVAARSPAALRTVPNARRQLAARARNVVVNALYDVQRSPESIVFSRRLPRALLVDFPSLTELLPDRVTVRGDEAGAARGRVRSIMERLLEDRVLIDVPAAY
jgi:SAM-dependent methyltransferase